MDKEAVGASQSERGPASAPTPPRLTPNPMLLHDSPAQTPVTSSPPPLTPAPKMAAARTSSPHVLVPAPPKLTTTASPALRTYARPMTTAHASSASAEDASSCSSTCGTLTNGSARSVATPNCTTITPFHTPASPPGRQAPQPLPAAPPAARHGPSQQALLLGKGVKGPGRQEQVLLRAQMLILTSAMRAGPSSSSSSSAQSGMATPPSPATPPCLRLKPPASAPPPLSRPPTALFPPLRPRPPTAPGRHLAVPPPTLYSPLRAVPLRPKLQSARAAWPRLPSAAQADVLTATSSASRRLQIIALSSAGPPPSSARGALRPQSAASPPRRSPGGLRDVRVAQDDQRREEDKTDAAGPPEPRQMDVTEDGPGDRVTELPQAEAPPAVKRPQTLKEARGDSHVRQVAAHPEALAVRPSEEPRAHAVGPLPGDHTSEERVADDITGAKNDNVSAHSDNHSALSSLSSQSPPSSPSADGPARPLNLSQWQRAVANAGPTPAPEDDDEGRVAHGPWAQGAWPEGRDVLTHVVEGFVIQEQLQPFPVNRSSLLLLPQPPQEVNVSNGKAPEEATRHSSDSQDDGGKDARQHATRASQCERAVLHCQFCGKRGHAHNFMRSKRFCSTSCARGFNVRLTKRLRALSAGSRAERPPRPLLNRAQSVPGKPLLLRLPRDLWSAARRDKDNKEDKKLVVADQEEEEAEEVAVTTRTESPASERAGTTSATPTSTFKPHPSQWSVEDVSAFIHTLPGCGEVSSAFRLQEIDGQALLLLTEEHLMASMNIKLGPALKICAHINALKNA